MENFTSQLQEATQQVDLSTIGITSDQFVKMGMIVCLLVVAMALLNCFFGLKLLRVWTTLLGLVIGFCIGVVVSAVVVNASTNISLIAGLVVGIIFAVLGFFLFKISVFILCLFLGTGFVIAMTPSSISDSIVVYIIAIVVGLVLAILAMKFLEPIVIISTGLQGGITAAAVSCTIFNIPGTYTYLIIGVVLAVLGIVVQFIMDSHKKVKQHLKQAEKVRAENSTESEVEKLRSALDHTDKIREDEDADDYYDDEDEY